MFTVNFNILQKKKKTETGLRQTESDSVIVKRVGGGGGGREKESSPARVKKRWRIRIKTVSCPAGVNV